MHYISAIYALFYHCIMFVIKKPGCACVTKGFLLSHMPSTSIPITIFYIS